MWRNREKNYVWIWYVMFLIGISWMNAKAWKLRSKNQKALNHSLKPSLLSRTQKTRHQTYCLRRSSMMSEIKKSSWLNKLRSLERWMRAFWQCLITRRFWKMLLLYCLKSKMVKSDHLCMEVLLLKKVKTLIQSIILRDHLFLTTIMSILPILLEPLKLMRRLD